MECLLVDYFRFDDWWILFHFQFIFGLGWQILIHHQVLFQIAALEGDLFNRKRLHHSLQMVFLFVRRLLAPDILCFDR